MSKLYEKYLLLKRNDSDKENLLYLFKAGAFFIFLDKDAQIVSDILSLKLTHLTENVVKCGFPVSALEKYSKILSHCNYTLKIVESTRDTVVTVNNYKSNSMNIELLSAIAKVDTNVLSVKEAYDLLEKFRHTANLILGGAAHE